MTHNHIVKICVGSFYDPIFYCIICALVMKGEFDSLKSSFQSQIDNYNTSIDSKTDGAIAGYLAGVNMTKTEKLSSNLASIEKLYNVWWCNIPYNITLYEFY